MFIVFVLLSIYVILIGSVLYELVTTMLRKFGLTHRKGFASIFVDWALYQLFGIHHDDFCEFRW